MCDVYGSFHISLVVVYHICMSGFNGAFIPPLSMKNRRPIIDHPCTLPQQRQTSVLVSKGNLGKVKYSRFSSFTGAEL